MDYRLILVVEKLHGGSKQSIIHSLALILLQDFDLSETFGQVEASGNLEGTIEIHARMGGAPAIHEFGLRVSSCYWVLVLCFRLRYMPG